MRRGREAHHCAALVCFRLWDRGTAKLRVLGSVTQEPACYLEEAAILLGFRTLLFLLDQTLHLLVQRRISPLVAGFFFGKLGVAVTRGLDHCECGRGRKSRIATRGQAEIDARLGLVAVFLYESA